MKRSLLFVLLIVFIGISAQKDCITALNICGNSNINYSPNGYGNVYESLGGCLTSGGENHSVWYKFEIATSGTLTFVITPSTAVDYDWAVYGPNVTCNTLGLPIRCNAAGTFGATGLNMISTLLTATPGSTTPYCRYMDVVAGETYYLFIDNWVGLGYNTVAPFSLTWGGTATLADPFMNSSTTPHPFIPPGNPPSTSGGPQEIPICGTTSSFDFTTLSSGIINGNPNFTVTYHLTSNDALAGTAPLTSPYNITTNTTYYYSIAYHDPNNGGTPTCRQIGSFKFVDKSINLIISSIGTGICPAGGSLVLTSNQPTGNTWSTGETTPSITVTAGGTYTLTNTNGYCSATSSITINEYPNPNLSISGNLNICDNGSTVLTATATGTGNTYTWSTGANTPSITATSAGTYTVTVTTAEGCQYTAAATVISQPGINVNIATPQAITCNVTEVTLNATPSTYPPGSTFLWTTTNGTIVSGANTLTPVVNAAGYYKLVITSPSGCFAENTIYVSQNIFPPNVYITNATTICEGESVTFSATGTAVSYIWNGIPSTSTTFTDTPATTTTYEIIGIGANGCPTPQPIMITVNVIPAPNSILTDTITCPGIPAILEAGYDPSYSYLWSTGETTPSISPSASGVYTVSISNGSCSKTFSANLIYEPTPEIREITYEGEALTIIAVNHGVSPLEYSINNGFTWQTSHVFYNIEHNTTYNITVRNMGTSCSTETDYYTYFVPNTITPNQDGINDQIDFSQLIKFDNFHGIIVDRMGRTVFKPSEATPVWNGTLLGRPLPTDTYWYKLNWTDRLSKHLISKSGWIVVKNRD